MKVWVIQCPKGAFARSRWPLRQRPRRRVILVVVPVSPMKTSRCGSSRMCGWRVAVQRGRNRPSPYQGDRRKQEHIPAAEAARGAFLAASHDPRGLKHNMAAQA
jgi:hypothetical protein